MLTMNFTTRIGFAPVRMGMVAVALLAGVLAAGCGSKEDEQAASTAAATPAPAVPAPAPVSPEQAARDARMATAVADGKTSAPVDLRYDVLSKPAVGEMFEVELELRPRISADTLDVEIGDSPGLEIAGERTARILTVDAGQGYPFKVQVRGATAGIFYISVIAKVSTKVQTETRAFTIPVVIGTPTAAASQKPESQKDASGQPIESMPAKED
jgi:hypothetical protein